MWPPTGLRPSAPAKRALAPGSDCTWFVCHESLASPRSAPRTVETYHQDANVELLGHVRQLRQELVQFLLSVRQLAAAAVVDAETGHDAVDYQEAVFVAGEGGGERVQEFELVLAWEENLLASKVLHRKMGEGGPSYVRTSLLRARA